MSEDNQKEPLLVKVVGALVGIGIITCVAIFVYVVYLFISLI